MQCAEIPAESLIKIQILQTDVSLIGRGHVYKGQTDTCQDLEYKTHQSAATEDIKPAACTGGHRVACGRFEELAEMQSVINPKRDFSQHARFLFLLPGRLLKILLQLAQEDPEARRAKLDERRRTLVR